VALGKDGDKESQELVETKILLFCKEKLNKRLKTEVVKCDFAFLYENVN